MLVKKGLFWICENMFEQDLYLKGYVPYSVTAFSNAMQKCLDRQLTASGDTFLDLGAGEGKIVMAAARYGFRAHGIEFHPELVILAQEEIQTARRCSSLASNAICQIVKGSYYPAEYIQRRESGDAVALAHEHVFWQLFPGSGGSGISAFSYETDKKNRIFRPVATTPNPYSVLGISLPVVDIFFSYTWGPELPSQLEMFSLYAKPSALFINETAEEPHHHQELLEELDLRQEMLREWQRPSHIGLNITSGLMLYRKK